MVHHAVLGIAIAVIQTEQFHALVGIDKAAKGSVVNRHLVGGASMHVRGQLNLQAGRGIPADVLHYLNVQAKEFINGPVLFMTFRI